MKIMNRIYSLDFFKSIAILGVVVIHSLPGNSFTMLVIDTLFRWCVPFFFLASGYLIYSGIANKGFLYLKGYLSKIYLIFLEWAFLYLLFNIATLFYLKIVSGIDFKTEVINLLGSFFTIKNLLYYTMDSGYKGIFHLWFIVALFWSTIILFVFIKLKKVWLLAIVGLVLHIIGMFGQSFSFMWELPVSSNDAIFIGVFYVTMGYYIAEIKPVKMESNIHIVLIFLTLCLNITERVGLTYTFGAPWGDYHMSTIALALLIFLFCIWNPNIGKNSKISVFGKNSIGIYVLHVMIISVYGILTKAIGVPVILTTLSIIPVVYFGSYLGFKIYCRAKKLITLKLKIQWHLSQ
jgi:surface polysaccharide O-acyltransferase-like enzyme